MRIAEVGFGDDFRPLREAMELRLVCTLTTSLVYTQTVNSPGAFPIVVGWLTDWPADSLTD